MIFEVKTQAKIILLNWAPGRAPNRPEMKRLGTTSCIARSASGVIFFAAKMKNGQAALLSEDQFWATQVLA